MAVQTAIIAALVINYNGSLVGVVAFLVTYIAAAYTLMGGITPVDVLWSLQVLNIPILITGKMSQAYTNYSNGNTGQLSAVTCFMLFFGSATRVFTSIQVKLINFFQCNIITFLYFNIILNVNNNSIILI